MAYFETLLKFDKIMKKIDDIFDWLVIFYIGFCLILAIAGSIIPGRENLVYEFVTTIPGFASLFLLCASRGFKVHSKNKPQLTKHRTQIVVSLLFVAFLLTVLFVEAKGFGFMRGFLLAFALEIVGWLLKEMICLLFYREEKSKV